MTTNMDIKRGLESFFTTKNGRGQEKNLVDGLHAIASAINENAKSNQEIANALYELARAQRNDTQKNNQPTYDIGI